MSNLIPQPQDLLDGYPGFLGTPLPAIQLQLNMATALLAPSAWGDYYSQAVLLDTAHNLALMEIAASSNGAFQAAVGTVNSVSGAGISTSFNAAQVDSKSYREQWYSKTVYGQQLLRLWNMVIDSCVLST